MSGDSLFRVACQSREEQMDRGEGSYRALLYYYYLSYRALLYYYYLLYRGGQHQKQGQRGRWGQERGGAGAKRGSGSRGKGGGGGLTLKKKGAG